MLRVIKSTGKKEDFKTEKLRESIIKTLSEADVYWDFNIVSSIENRLIKYAQEQAKDGEIESDAIRDNLLYIFNSHEKGLRKAANAYKKYEKQKQANKDMRAVLDILSNEATDEKNDNANINGYTPSGRHLHISEDVIKSYMKNYYFSKEVVDAINDGVIYAHDLGWGTTTMTCVQIDLPKLFKDGFSTGHGFLRTPGNIKTAFLQSAIAIQSNQNDMWGGQSIPQYDYALAPYVLKTYKKHLKKICKDFRNNVKNVDEVVDKFTSIKDGLVGHLDLCQKALEYTKEDTMQGAESLVHNLNSMASRAGSQVPFSSLNFGLDTSPEGRMVTECVLKAQMSGLGKHETPIFPILIYILKKGVNFNQGDPNYDLFRLAMECSSKRLFPTYSFVDSSFNLPFYEKDPYYGAIQTMGCRTRVMSNVNGREGGFGRGNISFVTINLPMLALNARGDTDRFFTELDKALQLADKEMIERYEGQCKNRKYNFPSLMEQHIWLNSDSLKPNDEIREVVKQGTLSIGFVGLAETLICLTGKHHGENKDSDKLGYKIIQHMRKYCDKRVKETSLNYSLLATPAETYCKTAVEQIQKKYGYIKDISDRAYLTNSSHVPVWYDISIADKMKIEGKYHKLENAGHIAYVEVDGDISNNLEAFEQILHIMADNDCGYGAINIPIIEDPICGHSWQGDCSVCPYCGRNENDDI